MDKINHKQTVEQLTLIVEKSKNSKMEFHSDYKLNDAVNQIASLLNVSQIQAALFAIIFNFNMDDVDCETERILKFFGFKLPDFFTIKSDFERLLDMRLIKIKREAHAKNLYNSTFVVNQKVFDAIFNNMNIIEAIIEPDLTFNELCAWVKRIIRNRSLGSSSLFELVESVERIEEKNIKLPQLQKLKDLRVEIEERMILYYLTDQLTDNEFEVDLQMIVVEIFGHDNYIQLVNQFFSNEHELQGKGLVTVNSNGYIEDSTISLTDKAQDILLADAKVLYKNTTKTNHTILRYQSIIEKELFFNEKQKNEIDFL